MFKRQPCYFNNTPYWPSGTESAVLLSNTKGDSVFFQCCTAEPPVTFVVSSTRKAPDFLYYCNVIFQLETWPRGCSLIAQPSRVSYFAAHRPCMESLTNIYLLLLSGLHSQALKHILKCYGKNYDIKGVMFFTLVFKKKSTKPRCLKDEKEKILLRWGMREYTELENPVVHKGWAGQLNNCFFPSISNENWSIHRRRY